MLWRTIASAGLIACVLTAHSAFADEPAAGAPESRVRHVVDRALGLVGIRYRRGGSSSETGFDCSGLVGHVFRETLGLMLPRTAREISRSGTPVAKDELEPGDLVFFHTMRRTFSHVGIYLGDNRFVHAPSAGQDIGIADLRDRYWARRYDGARRISGDKP